MANTETECIDLIDAAQRQGVTLMIAYCMRYHPLITQLKKRLMQRLPATYFSSLFGPSSIQSVHPIHGCAALKRSAEDNYSVTGATILTFFYGSWTTASWNAYGHQPETPWMEREAQVTSA